MRGIRLRAFGKINYALEVRGLRQDGYHEIRTVLQSISLADRVEIERAKGGFELVVEPEDAGMGPVEENTVYKAWELLCKLEGGELPVKVRLRKEIPWGAGLGGGSADAAAFLFGANRIFGLGLREKELHRVGAGIGADVPFCLMGGTALGEGVGDDLTPLAAPPPHHLVLIKPDRGADTGEVYRAHDERSAKRAHHTDAVVVALRSGSISGLARAVDNDLAPVTAGLVPAVAAYRRELLRLGALGASMSGTGTAVYGIFESETDAHAALREVSAPFASVCGPMPCGFEVISA